MSENGGWVKKGHTCMNLCSNKPTLESVEFLGDNKTVTPLK